MGTETAQWSRRDPDSQLAIRPQARDAQSSPCKRSPSLDGIAEALLEIGGSRLGLIALARHLIQGFAHAHRPARSRSAVATASSPC